MLFFSALSPLESAPEEVRRVLERMENSPFHFQLTGSRHLGNNRENSDWDFFAGRTSRIEHFLRQQGFVAESTSCYLHDRSIVIIYTKGRVQVQLVKDYALKVRAQEILHSLPREARLLFVESSQPDRHEWWNWAIEMAELQRPGITDFVGGQYLKRNQN